MSHQRSGATTNTVEPLLILSSVESTAQICMEMLNSVIVAALWLNTHDELNFLVETNSTPLTAKADWRLVTRPSADNLLPEDEMKANFYHPCGCTFFAVNWTIIKCITYGSVKISNFLTWFFSNNWNLSSNSRYGGRGKHRSDLKKEKDYTWSRSDHIHLTITRNYAI